MKTICADEVMSVHVANIREKGYLVAKSYGSTVRWV